MRFIFDFKDGWNLSDYTFIFKLINPRKKQVFSSELSTVSENTANKGKKCINLTGHTSENLAYSLFNEVGLYSFELVATKKSSGRSIVSAPGWIHVIKNDNHTGEDYEIEDVYIQTHDSLKLIDRVTGENYILFFENGKLKFTQGGAD